MSSVDTSVKTSKISVTTSRLSKLLDSQTYAILSDLNLVSDRSITILSNLSGQKVLIGALRGMISRKMNLLLALILVAVILILCLFVLFLYN